MAKGFEDDNLFDWETDAPIDTTSQEQKQAGRAPSVVSAVGGNSDDGGNMAVEDEVNPSRNPSIVPTGSPLKGTRK